MLTFRRRAAWFSHRVRARLGLRVAAEQLEAGTDADVTAFYNARVTDCTFLDDPTHYEYPRARWLLDRDWNGATVLEIGCGNGGFTRLLAPLVDQIVAFDVSRPSLDELRTLHLPNVEAIEGLIEHYRPERRFDHIVMSEVLEHVRDPGSVIEHVVSLLAPGGTLLVTTPFGHWESHEHLQEFDLRSFAKLFALESSESHRISFLRDRDGRRRWLTAELSVPLV